MRVLLTCLAIFTFFSAAPFEKARAFDVTGPDGFSVLSEKLLPSVVNISSTQKPVAIEDFPEMPHFPPGSPFEDFFEEFMDKQENGMAPVPPTSLGSGFIIDAQKGYIVTNSHVVKDADEVRVTFHDDATIEAEVIGRDEKMDLAVLKVDTTAHNMTAVPFGDSDKLRVGHWILAIGNPFGLGGTVTAGIVSAQQRDINAGPYDDFIQTDASINRGNSGGPMFNIDGEVIGINTAIFSPSGGSVGIGFAIPSNLAKPVIDQLIAFGRTRRGWLGVRIQSVTDEIAESLALSPARGALIASITETGPAEKAGIKAGDIILEFGGKPIATMRDLPRMVAETAIGKKVDVTYWREGKQFKTSVEVGELEKAEDDGLLDAEQTEEEEKGESLVIESVGLGIRAISTADRQEHHIADDLQGVIVNHIEPKSEAALKDLAVGDIIVEINQQAVQTPQEALSLIEKAKKAGRSSVLLLINRDGDVRFVALRLKKK